MRLLWNSIKMAVIAGAVAVAPGGIASAMPDSWSITDVVEHLAIAEPQYWDQFNQSLADVNNAQTGTMARIVQGVGRAVNQAVVIAFLGIFAFNYVFTQTLLATHPEISVIK